MQLILGSDGKPPIEVREWLPGTCNCYTILVPYAGRDLEHKSLTIADDEYFQVPLIYDRDDNVLLCVGDLPGFRLRKDTSPEYTYRDDLEDYAPEVVGYTPSPRALTPASPIRRKERIAEAQLDQGEDAAEQQYFSRAELDDLLKIKASMDLLKQEKNRKDAQRLGKMNTNQVKGNGRRTTDSRGRQRTQEMGALNLGTTSRSRAASLAVEERQTLTKRTLPRYAVEDEPPTKKIKSTLR